MATKQQAAEAEAGAEPAPVWVAVARFGLRGDYAATPMAAAQLIRFVAARVNAPNDAPTTREEFDADGQERDVTIQWTFPTRADADAFADAALARGLHNCAVMTADEAVDAGPDRLVVSDAPPPVIIEELRAHLRQAMVTPEPAEAVEA